MNKIQILYSHISICPLSPCFLRPFLSLHPLFLLFIIFFFILAFSALSFLVFYYLLTVLRGHFNMRFSLALLSLSFLFLSFLSPLFFFFPPFSYFSFPLPADFWCGDGRHAAPLPTGLVILSTKWILKMSVTDKFPQITDFANASISGLLLGWFCHLRL